MVTEGAEDEMYKGKAGRGPPLRRPIIFVSRVWLVPGPNPNADGVFTSLDWTEHYSTPSLLITRGAKVQLPDGNIR